MMPFSVNGHENLFSGVGKSLRRAYLVAVHHREQGVRHNLSVALLQTIGIPSGKEGLQDLHILILCFPDVTLEGHTERS
ncbi:hypothetical protein Pla110_35150 [Polystyrenella longa]|uniref:Uncharacterized protein n=2 Tax=Polystyrenella longa TaxID=2528007 RepID=A0A518CRC7_9PLAN|nr:hypothetical protein Pla110_35150 [Polystyrenella longa]